MNEPTTVLVENETRASAFGLARPPPLRSRVRSGSRRSGASCPRARASKTSASRTSSTPRRAPSRRRTKPPRRRTERANALLLFVAGRRLRYTTRQSIYLNSHLLHDTHTIKQTRPYVTRSHVAPVRRVVHAFFGERDEPLVALLVFPRRRPCGDAVHLEALGRHLRGDVRGDLS